MKKKICLALVLSVLIAGVVFSQEEFSEMGKNTITIDLGPTLEGLIFGGIGEALEGNDTGITSWGFGFAAQYERQLLKSLSVAARFIYLGGGLGYGDRISSLNIDIHSIGIEGHARFYPGGKVFFLDGMLGYANLGVNFSGEFNDDGHRVKVGLETSRGFFTVGGKIGWRIKFGSGKGGFTFEPSIGYVYGFSSDDTIWTQVAKRVYDDSNGTEDIRDAKMEELFSLWIQDLIFIGGPRIGISIGWRF
jgi:hypothetical protein